LHKIVDGPTDRSYGVHVASMAGLPAEVVRRSEQVLDGLERRRRAAPASPPSTPTATSPGDQRLLFDETPPTPEWCRRLIDAVKAIDPDRTTPIDALRHLESLRQIVESSEAPGR
jgi:DNA mismatch repair protein MutS